MDTHLELEKKIAVLKAALEKAIAEMQTVLNVVSKHDTGQREYGSSDYEFVVKRLSKTLAEIAEMLGKC